MEPTTDQELEEERQQLVAAIRALRAENKRLKARIKKKLHAADGGRPKPINEE